MFTPAAMSSLAFRVAAVIVLVIVARTQEWRATFSTEEAGVEARRAPFAALFVSALVSWRMYRDPENVGFDDDVSFLKDAFPDAIGRSAERQARSALTCTSVPIYAHASIGTDVHAWINDARTAFVGFRGTEGFPDVLSNLDVRRRTLGIAQGVRVHNGFLEQFRAVEGDITQYLRAHANEYDDVVFTGHSLGGALAAIASLYYATAYGDNPAGLSISSSVTAPEQQQQQQQEGAFLSRKRIVTHTFGAPRVGNAAYARFYEACRARSDTLAEFWRVVNYEDPVPNVPISPRFFHALGDGEVCLTEQRECTASARARTLCCVRQRGVEGFAMTTWPGSLDDDVRFPAAAFVARPCTLALRVDPCDLIGEHDIQLYVHRLGRLATNGTTDDSGTSRETDAGRCRKRTRALCKKEDAAAWRSTQTLSPRAERSSVRSHASGRSLAATALSRHCSTACASRALRRTCMPRLPAANVNASAGP